MNNMYEFRFQAVRVPVLANGDVRSLSDAAEVRAATGVDGVMCARGMLENPTMFAGRGTTAKMYCLSISFYGLIRRFRFDARRVRLTVAADRARHRHAVHLLPSPPGLGPMHGILNAQQIISIASWTPIYNHWPFNCNT